MPFQLSAGVNVSEIDLTTIIPAVSTSVAGFAGDFNWGPVNEITTISDENELVDMFGKPDSSNYEDWFSAANFLSYSNNLKVVRAANTSTYNATVSGNTVLIKNDTDWELNHSSGANTYGTFAARYAGSLGNGIRVIMADSNTYTDLDSSMAAQLPIAPTESEYVSSRGGFNDEVHILVVDGDGTLTGVANTVMEKYQFLSKASDAKDESGNSIYYKNVISNRSRYLHWMSHPTEGTNWGTAGANTNFADMTSLVDVQLSGGADGTVSTGDVITAYDKFSSKDDVDISLLIAGSSGSTVITSLHSLVESRKDCVLFVSPQKSDVVDNYGSEASDVITYRDTLTSSSYMVMDCNWKYQYDKYNDVYRWVPCNADVAGLCARTDNLRDPWYSPGGLNRGILKNTIKLAWNPDKTDRDDLYVKGVNPIVTFAGEGTVLFGDKTMLTKPSAFDRINVRRLFIILEKAISKAARYTLFEFNDQFTRAQFVAMVEPYLRDIQGRRGITDFRVVCDETNNTGEIIDRNEFVGDIYVKPARSINYIQLNFIAVRTGVSFNTVVGQF